MPFSESRGQATQGPTQADRLLHAHTKLARTLRSTHYGHHVREYTADAPPTGIGFAKHIGNNAPFVVRGFASAWPALGSTGSDNASGTWSNELLVQVMAEYEVSVAVTGDGRADAVVLVQDAHSSRVPEKDIIRDFAEATITTSMDEHRRASRSSEDGTRHMFATPCTVKLPFSTALSYLLNEQRRLPIPNTPSHISATKSHHTPASPIPVRCNTTTSNSPSQPIIYLQAQNDCFRSEYPHLLDHLPANNLHPSWITDVLGESPEAINLWIGTKHSVSTMHSDPYENIYVVIRGSKTFVIAPPGEAWFYSKAWFRTGEWTSGSEGDERSIPSVVLQAAPDAPRIPWYPLPHPLHISDELLERYPRLKHRPRPYTVTVHAGDMLYLPRGWLHHVEQQEDEEGLCVAVNSWFEGWDGGMGRDWGFGRFVESVDSIIGGAEEDEETSEEEDFADEVDVFGTAMT